MEKCSDPPSFGNRITHDAITWRTPRRLLRVFRAVHDRTTLVRPSSRTSAEAVDISGSPQRRKRSILPGEWVCYLFFLRAPVFLPFLLRM